MPNHTVQYWSEWVVRHNDALPDRDVPATILIGTRPNGVQITFPSGITASIQWTKGNYCSRRSCAPGAHKDRHDPSGSPDAELAFWNSDNTWYHFGSDTVIGGQTVEQTRAWLTKAKDSINFLPLETDIVRCSEHEDLLEAAKAVLAQAGEFERQHDHYAALSAAIESRLRAAVESRLRGHRESRGR
jgi:hypothetical protein